MSNAEQIHFFCGFPTKKKRVVMESARGSVSLKEIHDSGHKSWALYLSSGIRGATAPLLPVNRHRGLNNHQLFLSLVGFSLPNWFIAAAAIETEFFYRLRDDYL